jgi:hypothetical protein
MLAETMPCVTVRSKNGDVRARTDGVILTIRKRALLPLDKTGL